MSEPDREPTEKPTNTKREAKEEDQWMIRNWIGVAVVSIFGLLLLALGMMQATGLVDLLAPVADTGAQQWGVFAVLALVVLALAGWSWSAIAG
ncbi:hypothetical protein ACFO5R_14490 [Halosolutus amylolyticus]|uniref:Uncharacterized protein n=1 Tax=Halosolutus amylolyticus TaxID=2932267 RepID=A0ABD5PRB0_9EURY|nr:hypothetical protein [Halosolutus amylolyticus]